MRTSLSTREEFAALRMFGTLQGRRPKDLRVAGIVRVHECPDGTVSVFLGPRRSARFAADGQQISGA